MKRGLFLTFGLSIILTIIREMLFERRPMVKEETTRNKVQEMIRNVHKDESKEEKIQECEIDLN